MPTLVVDNGAGVLKASFVPQKLDHQAKLLDATPVHLPNCTAKSRAEKKFFVADGLDTAVDLSALYIRRAHDSGYIVDWGAELDVWQRMCHADVLGVKPSETNLLVTEPLFSCSELKDNLAEFVFEEMGFHKYCAVPPPLLAYVDHKAWDPESVLSRTGCGILFDSGFSFSHVVPFYEGKIVYRACKRIDLGGKALTNLLKENLSTRQWNVMEESVLINAIKERSSFVSQDLREDLLASRRRGRANPIRRRYALPTGLPDEDRLGTLLDEPGGSAGGAGGFGGMGEREVVPSSPQKKAKIDAPLSPQKARQDDEAMLLLNNERFTVPEALFSPTILGMEQRGVADAIQSALALLDPGLHPLLYSTVVPIGGNAMIPGFQTRLAKEIRALAPCDFEVCVPASPQPPDEAAWRGGIRAAAAGTFDNLWVSKAEYEEKGPLLVRTRMKEADAVFRVKKIK